MAEAFPKIRHDAACPMPSRNSSNMPARRPETIVSASSGLVAQYPSIPSPYVGGKTSAGSGKTGELLATKMERRWS